MAGVIAILHHRRQGSIFLPHSAVISTIWLISDDLRVLSDVFCEVIAEKIHCRGNRINHGHPCGMEFTFVSLYSTEINRYRSLFLEYKPTWVNSVLHERPWCIFYIQHSQCYWCQWPCNTMIKGIRSPNILTYFWITPVAEVLNDIEVETKWPSFCKQYFLGR